jgi:replication factor C subunit 2/4
MTSMDVEEETDAPVHSAAAASNRPWVERYRPKDLTQVSHQTEVVATLQNAVATGRLPHLLFYGPAGSGKVSI